MSDFSIPGVGTSKYGSDKLIEGLMKLERVPRDKAAERLKSFQDQKTIWLDFNQRLSTLRDGSRNLYSFRNPFNERLAKSSDEEVLTAAATREAIEQTRSVQVKRAAAADRFLSSELAKDYRVPAGTYTFTVGDKSLDLRFAGGSLQDFADALNRKGEGLIRAQVVSVKPETRSLVIESLKTGAANRLSFDAEAAKLALDTGLVEKALSSRRDLDPTKAVSWETPLDTTLVGAGSGALSLVAGGEAKLALQAPVKSAGMVLELEYRLVPLPTVGVPSPPPGPSLGSVGSTTYEGITVTGAPSAAGLPEWTPPPAPPRVEDKAMASLLAPDGKAVPLPELQDGDGKQLLRVQLSDYLPEAAGIGLRVKDTTRRLEVTAARIYDPTEAGGYRPLKPISTAQDALVAVDGIEAVRPSNDISDLVPGVTLTVKSASDKPVKLSVEPNRDAVKEAIIAFVGNYNRLMAQINILSRNDERLIGEITYLSDDEKKSAREHLGALQGDSTLSLLRTSLERVMMNPYPTKDGLDMTLLAQIGVATDARRPGSGGGFDQSKMRGYLEIEDDTLKKALDEHFEAVKQLFGNDTTGDLVVNSGVAYSVDMLLRPYVETGGIVALKTGTLDTEIGSEKSTIESLDQQLASKEADLKRKYGMMEGALNQMQGTSSAIDNFSKNGGQ